MFPDDLVTIFTLSDPTQASMIKNALQAEGIPCLLDGIEQANTVGLPGTSILVQVPAEYNDRARKLIEGSERK